MLMARTVALAVAGVLLVIATLAAFVPRSGPAAAGFTVHRSAHAIVWSEPGVAPGRPTSVASEVDRLWAGIGRDLGSAPPRLRVDLYGAHAGFERAVRRLGGTPPQGLTDNTGSVIADTLPVGPVSVPYLRHNLAHVYAEWIVDRLTGNRAGALPAMTWLYDGLAEYEAYRYAPAGMQCALKGHASLDITTVRAAGQWLALRDGPFGALEYCLAYARTRALVRRIGLPAIRRALHHGWNWPTVARRLTAVP